MASNSAEYYRDRYRNNPRDRELRKERGRKYSPIWRDNNPAKYLLAKSKYNAKVRELSFEITIEDIIIPNQCPVFNRPFEWKTRFAPSIDRIDNALGYSPGNVQVISRLANTMKLDACKEELVLFAKWVLRTYEQDTA